MFLDLVIFVSVYWIFIRKLNELLENHLIKKELMTKIGTAQLVFLIFSYLISNKSNYFFLISVFLPLILVYLAHFIIKKQREAHFYKVFLVFLNQIILNMKVGNSFRSSFESLLDQYDDYFNEKIKEMYNFVVFSQQKTQKFSNDQVSVIVKQLIFSDRQPHLAIKRLENLRNKLKIESDFRHRSGQVSYQIRLQSLIIVCLYIALQVFVFSSFQTKQFANLIFVSNTLFFIGVFLIFRIGRNYKWKV